MQIAVNWSSEVKRGFPNLAICVGTVNGTHVEKENEEIRKLRETVYDEVKTKYSIETLKDDLTVRAYRDFYWKLRIDPTKTRPSGEALLRRVLNGNQLPCISAVVDAYNLASMKTIISISGFDRDRLAPPFRVRFAVNGEVFAGIGMDTPMQLTDRMLVLTDERRVLCIYPYRDCDHTKISLETRNAVIVGYGAPGITMEQLKRAVEMTLAYIKQVSGGEIAEISVFGE